MSNTAKLVAYVILSAAGPALHALLLVEPGWAWLSFLTPLVGSLLAGLHVDGLEASRQLAAAHARIAVLAARLGESPTALPLATLITVGAACLLSACSIFQSPQGQAVEQAGVDLAVCVLNHINEPIAQIASDCDNAATSDVEKILDAHNAALARQRGDAGPDAHVDGGP